MQRNMNEFRFLIGVILKSQITAYLITTSVNVFTFTSCYLLFTHYLNEFIIASILANVISLVIAIWFTMDFWWVKVTKTISKPIKFQRRVEFSLISIFAMLVTAVFLVLFGKYSEINFVTGWIVNYTVLIFISIAKYLLFLKTMFR